MGILDILFGFSSSGGGTKRKISFKDKLKLSRKDIIDLVWSIKSLDTKQKKLVQEYLEKQLDDGGVSEWEYEEIVRKLSLDRVELGLSEVDISNLKQVLYS